MSSSSKRNISHEAKGYVQFPSIQSDASMTTVERSPGRTSLFQTVNEPDIGQIVQSSTFHQGCSKFSNFSTQAKISRSPKSNSFSSSDQFPCCSGSEKENKVVESERGREKRRQNTESARRSRERKRAEVQRMEYLYEINEGKIKELEVIAEDLSKQLGRKKRFSDATSQTYDFEKNQDRPKWFGSAF